MNKNLPLINVQSLNLSDWGMSVGLITPEVAAELLALNFDCNRKVTPNAIKRYSRLLSEDKWLFAEPVKLSSDGRLIDGQHRLNAVISSGIAAPFIVLTGYPFESAQVLDQGRTRTAIQIGQIRGREVPGLWISVLRGVAEMVSPSKFTFSTAEVNVLAEIYKKPLKFACQYSDMRNAIRHSSVLSAVAMASTEENNERLDEFLRCYQSNRATSESDYAATDLRAWIQKNIDGQKLSGSSRKAVFYTAQTVIANFLAGTTPKQLKQTKRILWGEDYFSLKEMRKALSEYGDIYA